jgi:hypothetical protein
LVETVGAAQDESTLLDAVAHAEVKLGFILLPRSRAVERGFAGATRYDLLTEDDERPPEAVAGPHFAVLAIRILTRKSTL